MSGWIDWSVGLDNAATNRAENLLNLFLTLSPCWELNYSKQSAANRWILYQLHSTKPSDLSSCPEVENKLIFLGLNLT